ncbi:MAG TPA: ATP-binding cassette domain-containing protein, partial [Dehalococcoidia bacterium]|nr:ATP-binding cassette domain-containing protein [Dehalococcoidia bacterium]
MAPREQRDGRIRPIRNFLFTRDDLRKRVSDLSGGEHNRLQLAALMKLKPNFLIIAELTNYL